MASPSSVTTATTHDTTPEQVLSKIEKLPRQDTEDAPTLYAYYGNFGIAEPIRITMEALCAELVRAKYAVQNDGGKKLTEDRIKHLARSHDFYLDLLREQALGRKAWYDECRAHGEVVR